MSVEAQRRLGYHPPAGPEQAKLFEDNRARFIDLYEFLEGRFEPSRELSLALTAIQEGLMWANAHIACNGVVGPERPGPLPSV